MQRQSIDDGSCSPTMYPSTLAAQLYQACQGKSGTEKVKSVAKGNFLIVAGGRLPISRRGEDAMLE